MQLIVDCQCPDNGPNSPAAVSAALCATRHLHTYCTLKFTSPLQQGNVSLVIVRRNCIKQQLLANANGSQVFT